MITKEQAIKLTHRDELHYGECIDIVGPKGGLKSKRETWRVNGRAQTWKRDPARFSVPLKYGFNGPYTYLTQDNAEDFHLASECKPVIHKRDRDSERVSDLTRPGDPAWR